LAGAQSIETSIREGFTVVILRYQCLMPTSLQSARALSAIQASLYIQGNMWNIPFSVVIAALAKIAEGGPLPVIERFGRCCCVGQDFARTSWHRWIPGDSGCLLLQIEHDGRVLEVTGEDIAIPRRRAAWWTKRGSRSAC
jgi:hypothetical protein